MEIEKQISQEPNLDQIGYLARRVMTASLRDLQKTVPELDVTIGQMGTLVLIARNPGISPTEICRAQGLDKSTITSSLEKLARKKLIRRRVSRVDRRSYAVWLTEKGKAFYEHAVPLSRESDQRLTRSLSAEERKILLELLRRIYFQECAQDSVVATSATRKIPNHHGTPRERVLLKRMAELEQLNLTLKRQLETLRHERASKKVRRRSRPSVALRASAPTVEA